MPWSLVVFVTRLLFDYCDCCAGIDMYHLALQRYEEE